MTLPSLDVIARKPHMVNVVRCETKDRIRMTSSAYRIKTGMF